MRKPRSVLFLCKGGPYDGLKLRLVDSGTIEFKVGKFKGYYNQQMNWIDTGNDNI